MDQTTKTSTRAIVSLILAIVAWPSIACFGCGGIVFGLAAVLVGVSARRQITASDGMETGEGLARAGVIIGAIAAVLGLLFGLGMLIIPGLTLVGPGIQEFFEEIVQQLGAA
jgi:hypothetical protein